MYTKKMADSVYFIQNQPFILNLYYFYQPSKLLSGYPFQPF